MKKFLFAFVTVIALSGAVGAVLVAYPDSAAAQTIPVINLQQLLDAYGTAMEKTVWQQYLWCWINMIFQVLAVALGIITTLCLAFQNERKPWRKTIGIICSVLSTGIITLYSTFHIHENIRTLLDIEFRLVSSKNELEYYIRSHDSGKTDKNDLDEEKKYSDILNKLGNEDRATWGLIGRVEQPSTSDVGVNLSRETPPAK